MTNIWLIGDFHFGHAKVARIRGFEKPEQHDQALREQWTKQVAPADVVWVLGDISIGSPRAERYALTILHELPGRKRLIAGNHDSVSGIHRRVSPNTDRFREVFEHIADHGRIRIEGENILLSHFPYASQGDGPRRGEARHLQYRLPDFGSRLVHAHTHHTHPTDGSATGRELCVSWDAWGRLVDSGDVARWLTGTQDPLLQLENLTPGA